jgi:transcriptional regulator with XRE-family HTH domain
MPKITLNGDKIRQLRNAQGLSQTELAGKCGFGGHSLISKIERNSEHGVMLETAGLLADALGVPLDSVVERQYTPPPQAPTSTGDYETRQRRINRIVELAQDLPPERLEFVLELTETQLHMHRQEELEKEESGSS